MATRHFGMIINPRARTTRRFFLWDLMFPNIAAIIAVLCLRMIEGPIASVAVGAIVVVLLWSANVAAPMARLRDIGLPGALHLFVLGAAVTLAVIRAPQDVVDALEGLFDGLSLADLGDLPGLNPTSGSLAGLIVLVEVVALLILPGRKRGNRFGTNPRARARA
ncbi:MAG: DUF805 domain-containing protein [Pseudomonadota bacterium]